MITDIRKHLVPLQLLDINKCTTVGNTVSQMENCAIGARMIGEAAATMTRWIKEGKTPRVIFDNPYPNDHVFNLMVRDFSLKLGPLQLPISSEKYAYKSAEPVIVLGDFQHQWERLLFDRGEENALFINNISQAPPWVRDGYFKGFVNADPRLIVPILSLIYDERILKLPCSFSLLLEKWKKCGGVAHQAAHGFETFRQMIDDPDCTVIATMSGIMTMAKMGGLISHMIDRGWAQVIVATGALVGHGFVEGAGLKHFKYDPRYDDILMGEQKLNRITDTVEPEENLDHVEEILHRALLGKALFSPSQILKEIGYYLQENYPDQPSILRSAFEKNVPIFIPAFYDSELGNDLMIHNYRQRQGGGSIIELDQELDNYELIEIVTGAKKVGIFTLGGGVPRNWPQNVAPLIEIMNTRLGIGYPEFKYAHGCRICPDSVFLGHLSGCTYSENASWRKTDIEHGRFSEVMADATIVYPFYMAAMKEVIESR